MQQLVFDHARHPRPHRLDSGLDVHNLVTANTIPFHRAYYIPEDMVNGRVMHIYNKNTLRQIHNTSGRSPYSRRVFDGGRKLPRRLAGHYKWQQRQ
jgi:hypothetical protein